MSQGRDSFDRRLPLSFSLDGEMKTLVCFNRQGAPDKVSVEEDLQPLGKWVHLGSPVFLLIPAYTLHGMYLLSLSVTAPAPDFPLSKHGGGTPTTYIRCTPPRMTQK